VYLWFTTSIHRFSKEIIFQLNLAMRDLEKINIFSRPHPPKDFGISMVSHLTQGISKVSFEPAHKNLKHNFLNFSINPFGI
jgi:hypothetical protein